MPKRPINAEDLLRITFVGDPQISPDGARVLFTKKTINGKNKYITNLVTADADGNLQEWTQGDGGNSHGRWSPDGTQIAFISGRDKPAPQIFLISAHGGEARKLTDLPEGSIAGFKWSPDGNRIAFLFRETHPNWTEKAKKEREEKGLSTPPWEIDDIWYRLDGDGYFGPQRYALYLADAKTGEHRLLYSGSPLGNYQFDWAPNSQELIVSHSASKHPFREPDNDQLYRVDLQGQAWQLEGLPKGEKSSPRWSPDGKTIAYVGHYHPDDPWGVYNQRLYLVSAEGGEPRGLTENDDICLGTSTLSDTKDASFDAYLAWTPDSQALYVQVGRHGETQIGMVSVANGGIETLTKGHHAIGLGSLSKDGARMAVTFGNAVKIPEIGVYDFGSTREEPEIWTHLNRELHEEIKLSEPEEVWLESTDGVQVQAWVMKPTGYLEPKRYPAVLQIHGGPHAQYGWAFFHEFQVLAAAGYAVVFSNPRGSKGYGEAFCGAIMRNWGNKDWDDIQTVTRWMQHQPYIHPGRMGVMGGSYGGYMTNWTVGHTDAFKAAITDRCVSNMVSMAGNSDFPFNKDGYFGGNAWGDLEEIAPLWKQSPIAFFKDVKTPMLIIHSEGDLRCNVEQGEQVFCALQQSGVPSRFVRYPASTSHGMSRSGPPDLRLHRLGEIVKWWDKWLG